MKVLCTCKICFLAGYNLVADMLLTDMIQRDATFLPSPEQLKQKILLKVCILIYLDAEAKPQWLMDCENKV